jgi:dienelactone hydrolase
LAKRFAAATFAVLLLAAPAGAIEQVEIAAADGALKAVLLKPDGAGPFPAIVALHGCNGLGTRIALLGRRERDWGRRWLDAGYAVLFPDSFGSRGAGQQCTERGRSILPRVERARDVGVAKRWLQDQPWVKADRVYLVGWSHGGSTALWSVRPGEGQAGKADFRAAIAFYPGCRQPARRGWTARLPILILIGEADDWTPVAPCREMVAAARERSTALTEFVTYPGAHHGFDAPNAPIRQRTGLAFTADGSGNAHIGTDPAARADAIRRVTEWLAR